MTVELKELQLERTPRRETREAYARFLLRRADVDDLTAEEFLNEKQAALFGHSPIELIYTGRYELAISAVEDFTESL